jgi:hypothetical protein
MKLLTVLALLSLGIWLPVACMQAMERQAEIDAREADRALVARIGR